MKLFTTISLEEKEFCLHVIHNIILVATARWRIIEVKNICPDVAGDTWFESHKEINQMSKCSLAGLQIAADSLFIDSHFFPMIFNRLFYPINAIQIYLIEP